MKLYCEKCKGRGFISENAELGHAVENCNACNGKGYILDCEMEKRIERLLEIENLMESKKINIDKMLENFVSLRQLSFIGKAAIQAAHHDKKISLVDDQVMIEEDGFLIEITEWAEEIALSEISLDELMEGFSE